MDWLGLTKYIASTASVAGGTAPVVCPRPASQPMPNWSTLVERSRRMSAPGCVEMAATGAAVNSVFLVATNGATPAVVAVNALAGSVYVRTGEFAGDQKTKAFKAPLVPESRSLSNGTLIFPAYGSGRMGSRYCRPKPMT